MIGHTLSKSISHGEACLLQPEHQRGGIKLECDGFLVCTVDASTTSKINLHHFPQRGGRAFPGAETERLGCPTSEEEEDTLTSTPPASKLHGIWSL